MSFLDNWSKKLESSFAEFAELGAEVQDIDLNFGIISAALLWPVREALEDDEGYDALFEVCGPRANQVLRAMRTWADDPKAAARDLAEQSRMNDKLQAALTSLSEHFEATTRFSEKLAQVLVQQQGNGDVYNLTGQIKAALVNIGGTTNIQSLTVQITQSPPAPAQPDVPPPPEPLALPEISEFVGRDEELAYFADKLTTTHQAVICGMAGIGKTVAAAMLAHVWQAQHLLPADDAAASDSTDEPSKIFWHTFYAGEGVNTLIWKLAGFLAWHDQDDVWQLLNGTQQTGGQLPPVSALFDYLFQLLRGQNYLLCLDAFQFINDDPALEDFVSRLQAAVRAGDLELIITSRQVPGFVEATTFDPLSGLGPADTERLLEARSLSLAADLAADLHQRTAGNPQLLMLAINVLKRAKQPDQVLSRLAEVDDLERYLIKEVDDGLSEDDREVMIGVAALLGYPGSRYAIEATLERPRLKRPILELSDRYLLLVHEDEDGESYNQHVMVQDFFYDLPSPRERREMHRRAGEYYEIDEPKSLRAALHYERAGLFEKAAALASEHTWEYINEGYALILRHLLERFSEQQVTPEQWVKVNLARGTVYGFLGERALAKERYRAALDRAETFAGDQKASFIARGCLGLGELLELEDPKAALTWLQQGLDEVTGRQTVEAAALYIRLSSVQIAVGDYDSALEAVDQGLALLSDHTTQLRAGAYINLGYIHLVRGDLAQSREAFQQALTISEALHDSFRLITIWSNLGIIKYYDGDWTTAVTDWQQALTVAEQLGNIRQQAILNQNIGEIEAKQGNDDSAVTHFSRSLELARQVTLAEYEALSLSGLAQTHLRRGDPETAATLLGQAEQAALTIDLKYILPEIYRGYARLHLAQAKSGGSLETALDYIERSLLAARELQASQEEGISLRTLAEIKLAAAETEAALTAFSQSLSLLADLDPFEAARTKTAWGRYLSGGPDPAQGRQLLSEARTTFQDLGAQRDLAEVDQDL